MKFQKISWKRNSVHRTKLSVSCRSPISANSQKELDRLTSLEIIGKRYAFLFEDVWFILFQYMYFEKFVFLNSKYLAKDGKGIDINYDELDESYWLMFFNLIFTALIGLGGLTTIPYCFKRIKQGQTKSRIYYILTFIQILLQSTFPFLRAALVLTEVTDIMQQCLLVGFQV